MIERSKTIICKVECFKLRTKYKENHLKNIFILSSDNGFDFGVGSLKIDMMFIAWFNNSNLFDG